MATFTSRAGFLGSATQETKQRLLIEMDAVVVNSREAGADSEDAVRLAACHHTLLHMWAAT